MSEESEQQSVEQEPRPSGPGHHLRESREARKLTVSQVAAQLHIQARVIEALENDDYSALPGTTFVQGYLRSYARLLGLSEHNILALAQTGREAEPVLVSSITHGKAEMSSRDLPFRMMSFLILMIVVVGLGWWLSQRDMGSLGIAERVSSQGGGEQQLLLPEEEPAPAGDAALEAGDSTVVAVEPETAAVTEDAEATASAVQVAAEPGQPAPAVVAAEESGGETEVASPALTPETPQSVIELVYQADSWSEITDDAGRKLAYGLMPQGKRLKLRGEAPFRVFLGYAPGVEIYYNGGLYDHTPFQRGDVARFRIGRPEHNRPASGN